MFAGNAPAHARIHTHTRAVWLVQSICIRHRYAGHTRAHRQAHTYARTRMLSIHLTHLYSLPLIRTHNTNHTNGSGQHCATSFNCPLDKPANPGYGDHIARGQTGTLPGSLTKSESPSKSPRGAEQGRTNKWHTPLDRPPLTGYSESTNLDNQISTPLCDGDQPRGFLG